MLNKPTIADFVQAYDDYESMLLADPELADEDISNLALQDTARIQSAIDDAYALVLSFYLPALQIGKAAIVASSKRDIMIIARHLLDTVKARQPVLEAYKEVLARLQKLSELKRDLALSEEEAIALGIAPSAGKLAFNQGQRIFTRDTTEDYRRGKLFF